MRSPRKRLTVKVDGKVFCEGAAVDVFVETLSYLGLDKVAKLPIAPAGWPLVGKEKPRNEQFYRLVDGWYVRTTSNTRDKHSTLETVGRCLGKNLEIRVSELREDLLA